MAAAVTDTIDQILDIGDARSIDTILTNRFNGIFENSYDLAPVNFKPNAFVYMVYSALLTLPSTKKMITKNIEGILVNKGRNNLKVIISYGTEDDTFKLKCINFDAQIVPKFEPWSSMVVKEAYMKMKMWKKFHTQPDKFKDAFTEMHHVTFNYVTIDETTRITVSITKSKINVDSDFITNPGSGNNFVQITPIIGVPSWRANIQQLESSSLNDVKTSSYALVKALITQYHTLFLRAKLSPIEKNFGFFVIGSLELNWGQSSHLRIKPLTNFPAHGFSEIMIKHDPPLKPWISTSIPIVVKFIHNTATDDLSAKSKISSLATSIVKDEKFIVVGIDFDRLIASLPKYTGQLWNDLPTYTTVQEVENRPIKNFVHELLSMNFQYDAHRMMPALDRFIREQNQNEERGFQSYFLGELMSYDEQKLVKYVYHHGLLRETATTFTFKVEGSDRGILIDILKWPDNKRMDENTKRFVNEYINKIAPVDKLNMKKVTRLVLGPIQKGITYMGELDTVDYADVQKQLTGFWENVATVNPDALLKYFEDSEEGFQRIDNKNELHTMLSILKTNLFQYKGVMSSADIGHFLNGIFSERKKIVYEDFFGVMKDDNSPIFFSIVDAPNQDHHVKLNNKMNEIEEKYLLEYTYNEFRRKTDFISIAHDNDDAEFSLSKLTSYGSRKSIFESCISRVKRNALVKCGGYEQINEASYREDSGIKAKIKFHLDVVGKVSKFLMQGQIFKDMISALIRGDYKSFALNTAFLTMGPLMESLSIRIAAKGVSFGASLLGVSMIFAAPFMARLPMIGFIGYDLIQQVRDYKNGNSDALVNIAGDSSILAIEFTTATVEGAEGLGLVAGVADFLGPVGLAIGTAIFIGVDIYSSVRTVSKIDSLVHLTAWQKFTTGFLSFLHLQPTETVRGEMHEQMAFATSMENAARFFDEHPTVRYYIFPSYQSNGEFVADNYIDLTTNVSKNVMKSDSNANLVCSDSSKLKTAVQMHVLNCRRAFGYESSLSAGGSAVIMLANGTDTAVTFKDEPTLFLIGDGVKFVTGSLASDTFILKGEVTVGYLNGHSGRNILNIAEYAKKRDHIVVDMLHGHVEFDHTYLEIQEIHNLIGRPFLQEFVQCHCETKFLDTQGGVNNTHPDDITIVLIKNCTYEMSIKLDGHVTVHNNALNGEFKYFTSSKFNAHLSFTEGSNAGHIFFLDHFVHELQSLIFTGLGGNQSTYNMTFNTNSSILNLWDINQNALFIFKEEAHLTISNNAITVSLTSNHTVDMIQNMYFDVANRLNAVLSVYSTLSNISLLFGSGMSIYHNFSKNINHINMLPSDPSHVTYLFGGFNHNVFRISAPSIHSAGNRCSDLEPMPPVTIFNYANEKYDNVIDLFEIILLIKEKFGGKIAITLTSTVSNMTIHLMVHCSNRSINLINITLDQAHKNSAFQKILVNMRRPTEIISNFNHMFLKPLDYNVQNSSYILIRNDLIEPFTTIKSTKIIGQYETFTLNNTSMILTNKNYVSEEEELIVVLLEKFFVDEDLQTLRLSFEDRTIRIVDEMENFKKSADFDDPFTDSFTSI